MHETRPTVSILIINYNTPQLVKLLLESLAKYVTGVSYEVRLLNNGCRDNGKVTEEHTQGKKVFLEESARNLGFAAGANRLATAARGDYLLFANSDCELISDIVTEMVHYLEEHSRCAACSPRTVYPDGTSYSTIRRLPTHENIGRARGAVVKTGKGDYTIEPVKSRVYVEAMAATFMMISAKSFRHAGGFDERFFMYTEDTDLCKRLRDYGYDLAYLGDLEVRHRLGASAKQRPWRAKWHLHRSTWLYFRKHYPDKTLANLWLGFKLSANLILVTFKLLLRPGQIV